MEFDRDLDYVAACVHYGLKPELHESSVALENYCKIGSLRRKPAKKSVVKAAETLGLALAPATSPTGPGTRSLYGFDGLLRIWALA